MKDWEKEYLYWWKKNLSKIKKLLLRYYEVKKGDWQDGSPMNWYYCKFCKYSEAIMFEGFILEHLWKEHRNNVNVGEKQILKKFIKYYRICS